MDAWRHFEKWHAWQEILTLSHLLVITRPDYSATALSIEWQKKQVLSEQEIRQFKAGKLLFMSVPASTAASTDIRERIQKRKSVVDILPAKVRAYIEAKGLYL